MTNVPAQSLTLLNSAYVQELARNWAQHQLEDGPPADKGNAIREMFVAAFGRFPQDEETRTLVDYVTELETRLQRQARDHAALSQSLHAKESAIARLLDPVRERLREQRGTNATGLPAPIAQWDFGSGWQDARGDLHGGAVGEVTRDQDALVVAGNGYVATAPAAATLPPRRWPPPYSSRRWTRVVVA